MYLNPLIPMSGVDSNSTNSVVDFSQSDSIVSLFLEMLV